MLGLARSHATSPTVCLQESEARGCCVAPRLPAGPVHPSSHKPNTHRPWDTAAQNNAFSG